MSRYRFALRPRWIVSHLFVAVLVAAMVWACAWQVSRLGDRRDLNATIRARTSELVVGVETLTEPGGYASSGALEFRRVTAAGRYLTDQEVLVRSRSRDGAPGSWVLTPLELSDGLAVAVNRGWISNSGQLEGVPDRFAAPAGDVVVTGVVRLAETRGSFGPRDPEAGTLTNLARVDVARFDQQIEADLLPVYVQLDDARPAVTADDPAPVPIPALDEGPHLSYAVQWAIFTTVALVGYPLILRRRACELEREALDDDLDGPDPHDDPTPDDPRLDPVAAPTDPSA